MNCIICEKRPIDELGGTFTLAVNPKRHPERISVTASFEFPDLREKREPQLCVQCKVGLVRDLAEVMEGRLSWLDEQQANH